jgi:hypothetical protein
LIDATRIACGTYAPHRGNLLRKCEQTLISPNRPSAEPGENKRNPLRWVAHRVEIRTPERLRGPCKCCIGREAAGPGVGATP